MDRLTRKDRNDSGTGISKETLIDREYGGLSDYASRILTKLSDYEDAEEQVLNATGADLQSMIGEFMHYYNLQKEGRLVELPCKVGDDVWTIMCGMTGKHPALFRQEFTLSMFSHFGTAVFLTKEEAEAALAEMNKKENINE